MKRNQPKSWQPVSVLIFITVGNVGCWQLIPKSLSRNFPLLKGATLPKFILLPGLYPVTSYEMRPHSLSSTHPNIKGHLSSSITDSIVWGLCCNCITVQLLPLLNPAFLIPYPSQLLIPRALPNKPPACKSKRLYVCFLGNPMYDTHHVHTVT